MALQINLAKDPAAVSASTKIQLNLSKGDDFRIELFWDDPADLDAHALLATNTGAGGKIGGLEDILSTYLTKRWGADRPLPVNADGSFATQCGSLVHSPDSTTGAVLDIDEYIDIHGSKIPAGKNEIPIFVTIHEEDKVKNAPGYVAKTFSTVRNAGVRIRTKSGTVLKEFILSGEFAPFNGVQMGSLMLGPNGWEFAPVGVGINGDFNTILGYFS